MFKTNFLFKIYTFCLTKTMLIYIINESNQILGGVYSMKRTFQPNNHKKSKKLGFLKRSETKIINSRRKKGRKVLSH